MASLAVREIIAPKSPFVVMTAHTTLRAFGRAMHRRKRLGHLLRSRLSAMTITTAQLLTRGVFGMAESDPISFSAGRLPLMSSRLMANVAGGQIPSRFLRAKAVTLIAG
jgi:hypothetical protein